ncbi:MAG: glutamyl-tRNA reductase [Thermoleophilia bacterium]|nr:glutamyl-tRNA reductase [Thermoleophilia bacterium]
MRDDGAPIILCVGPTHKSASLAARERFALVGPAGRELVAELIEHPDILEAVALATCNRSELHLAVTDEGRTLPVIVAAFARLADADPSELSTMLEVRVDAEAVQHLMLTAAGVESVVIGEPQIQGQLVLALESAQAAGTCGPLLHRLFRAALKAGKQVRTDTGIAEGHASVGSVAAELVARRLGGLGDRRDVVLGAGKMGTLAVRSLTARGATEIMVANRSAARAARIAEQCSVDVTDFAGLDEQLVTCDAVVASTNAPHAVLTVEHLRPIIAQRNGRDLVLVDLAVPRDIEPGVGELPGCHLFDLDDLEHVVAETLHARASVLAEATVIVDAAAAAFAAWRREQEATPAIIAMRSAAEQIRSEEFARFARRMAHLAPEDRSRIEQLTRSITNRMLHTPTEHLRSRASGDELATPDPWLAAVEQLLGPGT